MYSSRAAARIVRCKRVPYRQQIRFESTSSAAGSKAGSNFASGVAGGVVGSALLYGVYSFTPAGQTASKLNKAASEANKQYKAAADKLQKSTPNADQAIESIKQFAYSYVGWIPGGRAYVDSAFDDLNLVREKHKDEADKIINDSYKHFQEISKGGLSMETASKAYEAIADLTRKVAELSGDAISDIIDNHPQLKNKLGGNVEKLKEIGSQYGPEAKKQVDETWGQVKDIFAGGWSAANLAKAKKLIDDKVQQLKKYGDQAWDKGLEAAKPYLDKNPKAKELIESNADALKQGNIKELFEKAKSAADSGDLKGLQDYVSGAAEKAKSKGSEAASSWGLDKYLNMIPEGGEIMPKLQQIAQIAEKHKDEGEKLLKETIDEIKAILEKKSAKAKDIAESAKEETKDTKDSGEGKKSK